MTLTSCLNVAARAAVVLSLPVLLMGAGPAQAQTDIDATERERAARLATEQQLEAIAVIDRHVMVRMRDGKRMAADIYRPKTGGPVPIIFERTPYNFNYWDVKLGAPRDMKRALTAVQRGYALVQMNERGHKFSEGNYEILGAPVTDGSDAIQWLSTQSWSNGKVGTTGCSSSAEWQMAVAARNDPGLATFNVQGFGAGVGKVGPYWEQGNWFRGGAIQMLFIDWIYGEQNQVRPMFPADTSQADLVRAARLFDLEPQMPPVDWEKANWHLPVKDILRAAGGPDGIFADAMDVPTGGNMVARAPNDPAWRKGGLWHEGMRIEKPGLWFVSWFDVSVSPNLAVYNEVRRTASPAVAEQQYLVIAPTLHCAYTRATEHTMIGDLDVGDARFDYAELVYGWMDRYLKGQDPEILKKQPKVMYYTMGSNRWNSADTWPPAQATTRSLYFASGGNANTQYGDGKLSSTVPDTDRPDGFIYDPVHPVPTLGGGACCMGKLKFGSFDQTVQETRNDILVYDSEVLREPMEATGPITVTLYVSSDAKDTDFTFKVIDVGPDGRGFNVVDNIQRMRYRDGYDKPLAWMTPGPIEKVVFQPIDTSYAFAAGHKVRVEISSSNFPRYDRNLNTGGHNFDEAVGVIAHNGVHHDPSHPSQVTFTVMQ